MRRFGRIVGAVAAFGFGYLIFLYLTIPDVRPLRTHNPATTAFIEIRARNPIGKGIWPAFWMLGTDFPTDSWPNCGEQDKDKLPVFTAEQFQQGRIEACDNCKTYIKCIDLSKDGHAVPQVDDLATLALDLWAQEQGYTPQHHNMFLLPSE